MAVSGFLKLLKHLNVKGLAVLSSSQSSYCSSSPCQPPGPSLLTQVKLLQLLAVCKEIVISCYRKSEDRVVLVSELYTMWVLGQCGGRTLVLYVAE
jgi:hypothetical protein